MLKIQERRRHVFVVWQVIEARYSDKWNTSRRNVWVFDAKNIKKNQNGIISPKISANMLSTSIYSTSWRPCINTIQRNDIWLNWPCPLNSEFFLKDLNWIDHHHFKKKHLLIERSLFQPTRGFKNFSTPWGEKKHPQQLTPCQVARLCPLDQHPKGLHKGQSKQFSGRKFHTGRDEILILCEEMLVFWNGVLF